MYNIVIYYHHLLLYLYISFIFSDHPVYFQPLSLLLYFSFSFFTLTDRDDCLLYAYIVSADMCFTFTIFLGEENLHEIHSLLPDYIIIKHHLIRSRTIDSFPSAPRNFSRLSIWKLIVILLCAGAAVTTYLFGYIYLYQSIIVVLSDTIQLY